MKNSLKWKITITSVTCHISGTAEHMIIIFGTVVWNDDIFRHFFIFLKIFIFWVVSGVKRQKTVKNDKKFCFSRSVSQDSYIIWLSFMVHMCKVVISPGLFFIFSNFWFFIWLSFMVHMCKNGNISKCLFHFFKILIFWVVRGVKVQKIF